MQKNVIKPPIVELVTLERSPTSPTPADNLATPDTRQTVSANLGVSHGSLYVDISRFDKSTSEANQAFGHASGQNSGPKHPTDVTMVTKELGTPEDPSEAFLRKAQPPTPLT
jgi:hypothetical protein